MAGRVPGPEGSGGKPAPIDGGTLWRGSSSPPGPIASDPARRVAGLVTTRWTPESIWAYRDFVRDAAVAYGRSEGKIDCADWALVILIRFARQNDLPVSLQRAGPGKQPAGEAFAGGTHYVDPSNPDASKSVYSQWASVESFARLRMGAKEILETSLRNTVDVPAVRELLPGDMLALESGTQRHVQLVLANDSTIAVADGSATRKRRRVIEILQGNLPATEVARAAWDLENGAYYRFDPGSLEWAVETADAPGDIHKLWQKTAFGRRWDFDHFNTADTARNR